MNRYFIFGQQGTGLHFIACLVRLLHNKDFYLDKITTAEEGIYDDIFSAHAFSETLEAIGINQYPEEECSKTALLELKKTLTGEHNVIKNADKRYIEYNILPAHYGNQETIDFILNTFENSKIIFIKFNEDDIKQICTNLFIKVYMRGLLKKAYGGVDRLRKLYKKKPLSIIFQKDRFLNINDEELSVFFKEVIDLEIVDHKFMKDLNPNDNVLTINFGEFNNLNNLLDNLSKFTQQPITDNLTKFAVGFLDNQPKYEQIKEYIKRIENNPASDFIYKEIIQNLKHLKNEDIIKILKPYNKKTFCIMPFIHQNIKHEGKVGACWRYPDRIGDYRSQTLDEIWNSKETRELRRAVLNDERPTGCRSCWDFEDSGVASTRQTCNETYKNSYNVDFDEVIANVAEDYSMPYQPQSIEIRFDNTCNLRCRHCSPTYSSQWEVLAFKDPEVKQFFTKWGAGRLERKHISLPERSFEEFKNAIPYLKEVLIAGGEPLQQKRHWEMIDAMSGYEQNITLSYNSNLVALGLGYYNVLDHWPKFKKIILRVSIDGDDSTFSYFRTNGDIQKVIANVQKLHELENVEMSLTTTVSIYNISRFVDIVKFVNAAGGLFHTSMVQYPKAINPKVLPKDIKAKITKDWTEFKQTLNDPALWTHSQWSNDKRRQQQKKRIIRYGDHAIDYMNAEDYSAELSETAEYINFMDKQNATSFAEVYPELASIL